MATPPSLVDPSTPPPGGYITTPIPPPPGVVGAAAAVTTEPGLVPSPTGAGTVPATPTPTPTTTPETTTPTTTTPTVTIDHPEYNLTDSLQSMEDYILKHMQPNTLNDFYQYTYHFRLFAVADKDQEKMISDGNNSTIPSVKQITIVESGITGYYIKEVLIKNGMWAPGGGQSTIAHEMRITIVDPLGVNFLDALAKATKELGLQNTAKVPYFLELTFTGYNQEDGSWAGRPLTNFPNGGIWLYGIIINNINNVVTEGGGVFTLDCKTIQTNTLIADIKPNPMTIPAGIVVSGKTVSEIYTNFVTAVNEKWATLYGGKPGKSLVVFKDVKTHPVPFVSVSSRGKDPGDFKLVPQQPNNSSISNWSFDKNGKATIHATAGDTVSSFLTSVIANTEEGMALVKDVPTLGKVDKAPSEIRQIITWSVHPTIVIKGIDSETNNYIREITCHVEAHYNNSVAQTKEEVNAKDENANRKRIKASIDNGFFKKRYDYIYTGRNTEVINFKIDWNFSWAAQIAAMAGGNAGAENLIVAEKTSPKDYKPQGNRFEGLIDLSSATSLSSFFSDLSKDIQIIQNGINSLKNDITSTISSGITRIESGITEAITPITSGISNGITKLTNSLPSMTSLGIPLNSPISAITNNITSKLTAPFGKIVPQVVSPNKNNQFAEDLLNPSSSSSNNDIKKIATTQTARPLNDAGSGMSGTYHRDKSIVGGIFAQIHGDYNAAYMSNAGFINIDLEIRGDPYWLGVTNIDKDKKLQSDKPSSTPSDMPNFSAGVPLFQLFFRYPQQLGEDFKPDIFKAGEYFNGLYMATEIHNTFVDGKFTQVLKGVIQPYADIGQLSKLSQNTRNGGGGSHTGGKGANTNPTFVGKPPPGQLPPGTVWERAYQTNPVAFQQNQSAAAAAMGLTPEQYAQYCATMGMRENSGYLGGQNSLGYQGLYQMGYGALRDAGFVEAGGSQSNPQGWVWSAQARALGVDSLQSFYSNASAQQTAFNNYNISNYNAMVNNGTIVPGTTSPETIGGLLGSAQLSGPGGTKTLVSSNFQNIRGDGSATNLQYFALGQAAIAKVTGTSVRIPGH